MVINRCRICKLIRIYEKLSRCKNRYKYTHKQRSARAERRLRQTNNNSNSNKKTNKQTQINRKIESIVSEFRLWLRFSDIGFQQCFFFWLLHEQSWWWFKHTHTHIHKHIYILTNWLTKGNQLSQDAWIGNWKIKSVWFLRRLKNKWYIWTEKKVWYKWTKWAKKK